MKRRFATMVMAAAGALASLSPANAASFTLHFGAGSESSNPVATGAAATVSFATEDTQDGDVRLILTLTNTTGEVVFGAGSTEAGFTGFAFDLLDDVTVRSSALGTAFNTLVTDLSFVPFSNRSEIGVFDLGLSDNRSFNGRNAAEALGAGESETVSLLLDTDLDALTLLTTYLAAFTSGDVDAAVRFQQTNRGDGSDKLLLGSITDDLNPVPVPGALVLFGTALASAAAARRRAR